MDAAEVFRCRNSGETRIHACTSYRLSTDSDANRGKRSVEADIFLFRRIDAAIHSAEE